MTSKYRFSTIDVFTDSPYEGNQLAIVLVPSLTTVSDENQLKVAVEFNLSETVFLQEAPEDGKYNARIYTTKSEIPFAGHPTIGTLCWIFSNLDTKKDTVSLMLKAGEVKATFDRTTQRATAEIPRNVRIHKVRFPWSRVEWSQPGLSSPGAAKAEFPLVSAVSGMNFTLVDLSSKPELLSKIVPNSNDIATAKDLDDGWLPTVIGNVFYYVKQDQGDGVIRIRQRVIVIDLEDPATGSASAALASYLSLQKGGAGQTYVYELEQGVEMGRRSVIGVSVTLTADGKALEKVALSGRSAEVMEGSLKI